MKFGRAELESTSAMFGAVIMMCCVGEYALSEVGQANFAVIIDQDVRLWVKSQSRILKYVGTTDPMEIAMNKTFIVKIH